MRSVTKLLFCCLLASLFAMIPLRPSAVEAGIYNADEEVTYKEYWISHSEFTGGCGSHEVPEGGSWYLEPWPCTKTLEFEIPDDFSQALKVEIYLDLWRNHVGQSARFALNGGPTHAPDVGYDWSRTPYVAEIPKSELQQGTNTITLWHTAGGYHVHDIGFRIYYDETHPLLPGPGSDVTPPDGQLASIEALNGTFLPGEGGALQVDDHQLVLNATASGASYVEFHAFYYGYDEDNDGQFLDWHNLGRNNRHPGSGGTIDHIGTDTGSPYTVVWDLSHITDQSGAKFKIRIVDSSGNVREAAGGVSAEFTLSRTDPVEAYVNPGFEDVVLYHDGMYPDTAVRHVDLPDDISNFNEAYIVGAYWRNPYISINSNPQFNAFVSGEDEWGLSVREIPFSFLRPGRNKIEYLHNTGFGEFIEEPGPMIVLRWTQPAFAVSRNALYFAGEQGGADPRIQHVGITNTGGGAIHWSVSVLGGSGWLNVAPGSGLNDGVIDVSASTTGLGAETYTDVLIVSADETTATAQISVTLDVTSEGTPLYSENFEGYTSDVDPDDWVDTKADGSLEVDDTLFKTFDLNGNKAFGTVSIQPNIHSHYVVTGSNIWSAYEYTGRMMVTADDGGIGITFLSHYPQEDSYYRLRRYGSDGSFHVSPHRTTITGGAVDTGVIPNPNDWYRFRIQVEPVGTQTEIKAKVWREGDAEPANWQVDCYDDHAARLTAGTVGLWAFSSGGKYWDDLAVNLLPRELDQFPPFTYGHEPAPGTFGVDPASSVSVHVADANLGVATPTLTMAIDGVFVTPTITGAPLDYALMYDPPVDFSPGEVVTVAVDACDLHVPPHCMATETYSFTAGASSPPVVDIWYGHYQRFGHIGKPQNYVNILGNVSDPDGVESLVYALNGVPQSTLVIGADTRRLASDGDFNIDLECTDLVSGTNRVVITATDSYAHQSVETVTVEYTSGNVWPEPYSVDWSSATSIQDVAQVVDGLWTLESDSVRPVITGYDRLVAIGDVSWDDYEVTVPITVHDVDMSTGPNSGQPALGLLMRWTGHTDNPVSGWQPKSGWVPFGAIGWWRFSSPTSATLEFYETGVSQGFAIDLGVTYMFKVRVDSTPGQGGLYRLKVWEEGEGEPAAWNLTHQADSSNLGNGSFLLLAHHVDASFGDVTVTPGPFDDAVPPVITNIQVTPGQTTATVTWTTDEPATSTVSYGLSAAYENGSVRHSVLVTDHLVFLSDLVSGTVYHYQVASADGSGNLASSTDLTFTTSFSDTDPPVISDVQATPGQTAAMVTWGTDEPATSTVFYGRSTAYEDGSEGNSALVTDHSVVLTDLISNTVYHYQVVSADADGNMASSSGLTFTTKAVSGSSGIVSDDFNACSLDTGLWTWTDPRGDATYAMTGTFTQDAWLSITVPSGTSHDIWNSGNFAPRIMQPAGDTDFEIEVKFESGVSTAYQMQGVLVEQDSDDSLRLEFHSDGSGTRLFAAILEPGSSDPLKPTIKYNQQIAGVNVAPLYMRVRRQQANDQWTQSYSFDGTNWTTPVTFTHDLTVTAVGAYAANAGSSPPAHTGQIDYFFNTASPIVPEDGDRNTLIVHAVGSGSVVTEPAKSSYDCGEVVTLTAEPDLGWSFAEWSGDLTSSETPVTVTMTGSQVITATFTQDEYTLTVNVVGGGSVTVDPDQSSYHYGDVVTLTTEAEPGWSFAGWSGALSGADERETIIITGDTTVTATFTQDEYTLTVSVTGEGTVTVDPDQSSYHYGDVVTLTTEAERGWSFAGWTGDLLGANERETITITGDTTVTATFTQDEYTLTVGVTGEGTVTVDPDQSSYRYGDVVTLTAQAEPEWSFAGWDGDLSGTNERETITITGDTTVTAVFVYGGHTLVIHTLGQGTVDKDPDYAVYPHDQVVTLTARADPTWTFAGWSGDLMGSAVTQTLTMSSDRVVTATFTSHQIFLPLVVNVHSSDLTGYGNGLGGGKPHKSAASVAYRSDTPFGDVAIVRSANSLSSTIVSDDFNAYTLDTDLWTFIDPLTDATHSMIGTFTENAWLSITVPSGTSHDIWESGNFAPRIMQPANDTDFEIEVKFESGLSEAYQMLGLLVEQDHDDFLRFEFYSEGSRTRLFAAILEPGTLNPLAPTVKYNEPITGLNELPLYMRVRREENEWTQSYSFDGTNWVAPVSFTHTMTVTAVGTYASNAGSSAPAYTGYIDYFFNTASPVVPEDGDRNTLTVRTVGSGSVVTEPAQPTYNYGDVVTLTATADLGWSFAEWSGDLTGTDESMTVTMMGSRVITATFTQDEYTLTVNTVGGGAVITEPVKPTYHYGDVVTFTAEADPGWTFAGWSGDLAGSDIRTSRVITGDTFVTATFTQDEYTLTVNTVGSGSVITEPVKPTYHYGEVVTFTAEADPGWTFVGWSGDLAGSDIRTSRVITGDTFVTATFTQDEYTVRVNTVGSGSVITEPVKPTYHYGEVVTFTAEADPGWTFAGWSGDLAGSDVTTTKTITGDTTVTAVFVHGGHTLVIHTLGQGTVDKDPDYAVYPHDQVVTLTARADPGWTFTEWGGDLTGSVETQTLTMSSDRVVTATFTQDEYMLTVSVVGAGTVMVDPDQSSYHYGDVVTLTAGVEPGWSFAGWGGDLSGTNVRETVTITGNVTVTATFTTHRIFLPLTINQYSQGSAARSATSPPAHVAARAAADELGAGPADTRSRRMAVWLLGRPN